MGLFDMIGDSIYDWMVGHEKDLNKLLQKGDRLIDKVGDDLIDFGGRADAVLGTGDCKDVLLGDRIERVFASNGPSKKTKAVYGDVIGVRRTMYEHYGVYVGRGQVVHYTKLNNDESEIMETQMGIFLDGSNCYFILNVESKKKTPITLQESVAGLPFLHGPVREKYTTRKTVQRARSRIGEKKYNLGLSNCEHFAIWCKTGVSVSFQVEEMLKEFGRPITVIV